MFRPALHIAVTIMLLFCPSAFSQNKADSIKKLLRSDKEDTTKVSHLFALIKIYQVSNAETLNVLAKQALALSEKLQYEPGLASSYHTLGIYHNLKGEYLEALKSYSEATLLWDKLIEAAPNNASYEEKKGRTLANSGVVYYNMGDYAKALDCYFTSLKISEKAGNAKDVYNNLIRIGLAYWGQDNYGKALDYELRALEKTEKAADKYSTAAALTNIALVYHRQKNYIKALEYYTRALALNREISNRYGEANLLHNIGTAYKDEGDYSKAVKYLVEAIRASTELDDQYGLAATYNDLGALYLSEKKYKDSFTYLYKSLATAREIGALDFVSHAYSQLTALYAESPVSLPDSTGGKMLSPEKMRLRALACQTLHYAYRDSVNSEETKKRSAQREMQYEFEKKETEARAEYAQQMALAEADRRRQNLVILAVSGFGLLVLVFAIFAYRSFLNKKKANIELDEKNKKIEMAYQIIEEKQKEILDSIRYARRIQRSLLPTDRYIHKNLKDLTRRIR